MVDLFPWPPSLTARLPLPPTNNNQPRTTATTTKLSPIIPTLVLFFFHLILSIGSLLISFPSC